jgi:hypothetical protein
MAVQISVGTTMPRYGQCCRCEIKYSGGHDFEYSQFQRNTKNHDIPSFVTPHFAKICAKVHAKAAKWEGMNIVIRYNDFEVVSLNSGTINSLSSISKLLIRAWERATCSLKADHAKATPRAEP